MVQEQKRSSYLLIVRAGKDSLHHAFSEATPDRKFDLFVYSYNQSVEPPIGANDQYLLRPGEKVASYASLFAERPDLLETYDYIALLDDDLEADIESLNTCFEMGAYYDLNVWQPSLTHDSYFSYAAFLRNPSFKLRFTNFVEMMCPFFQSDTLRRALPMLSMGYVVGPDLLWSRLHNDNLYKAAILDCASVKHTRAVGNTIGIETNGEVTGYDEVIAAFLDQTGETFRGNVAYAAVYANGNRTENRFAIALRYLRLVTKMFQSPCSPYVYARVVVTAMYHVFSRPIGLEPFSVDAIKAPGTPPAIEA